MATVALENNLNEVSFGLETTKGYFNNCTTGLKVMGLAEKGKTCEIREIFKM